MAKKPREVAFTIPVADTGDALERKYDMYGKNVGMEVRHKNLSYRPPKHDWEIALIHLAAKALEGQLRLVGDPKADRQKIQEVLLQGLDDSPIEPGASTVRDKADEIMAELARIRVRDE
ncbi:hypothetical protein LJR235_002371 [Pararhizobium sp. LjRoot235]|uniref:hypothetical protein n=1 Tax=Pararhizobium sp. LjRoot235 TaxID=3342291 RepID=UPI003ED0194E